ncbi:peptidyl-prolyl cis-trans isomerase [soil metagenome]
MLSFFRRFIGSRVGAYIALGFLLLIGFAFAAGDITGSGGLSVLGGSGDTVAKVGGRSLSTADVQSRTQKVFEQQRRSNPGLQIGEFLAQGGLTQVFDQMVAGLTVSRFAEKQGMSVSKRMVDGQIAAIPAFQDASGAFSQDLFRQLLGREGVSEQTLREDISRDLIGKQLVGPAGLDARLPNDLALPYASLVLEARTGKIAAIPAAAFLTAADPTPAQLQAYYTSNAARFTVPEQRRLRYAVIDAERFATAAVPTDAEIGAYYTQNKASYAASETRDFEQLILPTEAAAKTIAADVRAGKSMATAAQATGLAVATLKAQTRETLARASSDAAAQSGFTTPQGGLIGPLRTPLGWAILRVTAITSTPEKTLAQVRPQIVKQLEVQKQQKLLSDFTGKIEDQVGNGATFDEAVKDNGLAVETTPPLLATGQNVQQPDYKPSPDIQPLLQAGFGMAADDDAQIVPITAEKRYALLDVGDIIAAAPPPLDKVRPIVLQQYKLSQGNAKAKTLANQLRAKIAKGMKLEDALASAGVPLPPVQKAGGRRADIMRDDKRPPEELAILFAMAPGSVKILPISGDRGYFIVQLDQIVRGDAGKQPQLVAQVRDQLGTAASGEYAEQFERAIEKQLKVTRNTVALAKIEQELRRANGGAQ